MCPRNVWQHRRVRMSHTFTVLSREHDAMAFLVCRIAKLLTSPAWPRNSPILLPLSMSQRAIVLSPDEVKIWLLSINLQHDKNPACPLSSFRGCSIFATSQMVHLLSRPPEATKFPEGANAQAMTQFDNSAAADNFSPSLASQMTSFPSWQALNTRSLSAHQAMA